MSQERKELFRAIVGSHNYNLNTESSDRDYKVFVAPTFDDLYNNKMYSKSIIGEEQDLEFHDIRKISNLWWKANVNFLEVLFSQEIMYGLTVKEETIQLIEQIFTMRNDIVKMNLPYLYRACMGMYFNKFKYIHKGTEGTQHLVEQYGYDTKQALHVLRILDFLKRFANSNFEDFESSINYKDNDHFRSFLLAIKNGEYLFEEFEMIAQDMYDSIENEYRSKYINVEPNEETHKQLIEIIKQIVKNEL